MKRVDLSPVCRGRYSTTSLLVMLKSLSLVGLLPTVALAWAGNSATDELSASDFESTGMGPFFACTYKDPSSATAVSGMLETYFDERDYDGTREDRGVEICTDTPQVTKELWHGFKVFIPSDYPYGKQSIFSQHFCLGGCSSWCGTLAIVDNYLEIEHRSACGTATQVTLVDDITRDTWHPIVLNARFSNSNDGHYVVWYDGAEVYNVQGINLGFDDEWTSDGHMTAGVGFKNGQYNASTYITL